ncbi:MAG TPA: exopolyphosphatase [Bacteroidia bacterium]|nr:exopolyphosphatase [Bacteroidia bacterium]HNJ31370.1 exopolyphosphatase [Bacteroidia bacterium]
MAIAVIDCGTNTFHLLIADISDDSFKILFRKNLAVKLGEGGISSNKIAREAFNRGIDALKEFAADMKQFVIDKQLCYATEAIRRATNGNDFVEDAKKQSGITLEIIDGLREAELIYSGVSHAVPFGKEKVLIMDIGGGSTEFVIAGNGNILWRQSFPLGAALLLDMFKPSDPIHDVQVKLITEHINSVLLPLAEALKQHGNVNTLVGSAGSFDTFLDLCLHRFHRAKTNTTWWSMELEEFFDVHQILLTSTVAQRLEMPGMIAMRADMIVVASLLLHYVIHKHNMNKLLVSAYALKEGMLYFAMNKQSQQ